VRQPPNFDYLARPYRWLEYLSFGPYLQRTRTHFLSELRQCRRALVLGDGDGRFTAALLDANPEVQVHAVDASPKMLRALERSAGRHVHRVTTEIADVREWRPTGKMEYDLITTHFFLDCLNTAEVAELAARLAPAISTNARWVVSDFAIPESLFGKLLAAPLVASLYEAFRLLTGLRLRQLPDHSSALMDAGWTLEVQQHRLRGLLVCQLWLDASGKSLF
jgi:SAM-dependent methyltransferase